MEASTPYDVLVASADGAMRSGLTQILKTRVHARTSAHSSIRSALSSHIRASFNFMVIHGTAFGDCDCWRFLRMIRSGRFGFAYTPAFVLTTTEERNALEAARDEYTTIVAMDSPEAAIEEIVARRSTALPTVLLVEDEISAAQAAQRVLEKRFQLEICHDGESALAAWRARRHDLLILDLNLPNMSGEEVLQQIMQEHPQQPIVILTAHDAPERHQELILSGATEFLSKPTLLSKPMNLQALAMICTDVLREHACLHSAAQARAAASQITQLSDRIRAASFNLRCGRTAEAALHLQRATNSFNAEPPSEDQWNAYLEEFGDR